MLLGNFLYMLTNLITKANVKYHILQNNCQKCCSCAFCVKFICSQLDCASHPVLQGVPVELLCGFAPPGPHMDVSRPCHHWPALCTFPDPLCRLWFSGRLRDCYGALHPAKRGTSHDFTLGSLWHSNFLLRFLLVWNSFRFFHKKNRVLLVRSTNKVFCLNISIFCSSTVSWLYFGGIYTFLITLKIQISNKWFEIM